MIKQFVLSKLTHSCSKSQIAVELAYRWKDSFPTTSIVWIHASNNTLLDQSYREILSKLNVPETPDTNVKLLVENHLRNKKNGKWLMIVDNVDDETVVLEKRETGSGRTELQLLSSIPQVDVSLKFYTTQISPGREVCGQSREYDSWFETNRTLCRHAQNMVILFVAS